MQVFSTFWIVQKIAIFEKNVDLQALVQYLCMIYKLSEVDEINEYWQIGKCLDGGHWITSILFITK
jgi:hypothetical protein